MPRTYNLQVAEAKPRVNEIRVLRIEGHAGQRLFAFVTGARVYAVQMRSLRDGKVRRLCETRHQRLLAAVDAAVTAYVASDA